MSYVLAVVDEMAVRSGGPRNADGQAWNDVGKALPVPGPRESGATVACDFKLAPGELKTVRFVLTWYAPYWNAGALHRRSLISARFCPSLVLQSFRSQTNGNPMPSNRSTMPKTAPSQSALAQSLPTKPH